VVRRPVSRSGQNEFAQRPPPNSIRDLCWILRDDSNMEYAQHKKFLGIITREPLQQESGAGHSGGTAFSAPVQGGIK